MKLRDFKIVICILLIGIFVTKMFISVAPAILKLDNTTVTAAITQLEQETKGEKDTAEKEVIKDKKFTEEGILHYAGLGFTITATTILHTREHSLVIQLYHPVVPTPPPNA